METKDTLYFSKDEFLMDLGIKILQRRKELGMKKEELALKIGVCPKTMKQIETGIHAIKITIFHKLLLVLDMKYEDFIDEKYLDRSVLY